MKFSEFVKSEAIRAELAATDKEGVIRELVGALVDSGKIDTGEQEGIVKETYHIMTCTVLGMTSRFNYKMENFKQWLCRTTSRPAASTISRFI